ncbi:hypothetical protein TVAG_061580 [Trichomonas vaginalis G3]|uniref:Leucine Rich Repeat family protein n=1 Tax=Trichomonas vaginalis (strain ATCC PRA-98 / G3) TaxID=412133 RepID=A2E7S3_TRIV3|nr:leucine-rich repeat, isoform f-related family [Trichomonas vaginalis G3]EAY11254.1 hypothetical protein TVAG_061580 [Trichomonas vaginalis G3]KAI5553231.1 leucine-rich repeat, isoform f-related family [Trichomonas vaginalis G3]|eukprot:XP_001323477.1 hypothetical protein [Trichomonas vaginalis G3]
MSDELYCLPATTNDRGEIDCLAPKANHSPDLLDEIYRKPISKEEWDELRAEINKLSPLGSANRQNICFAVRAVVRFEKRNHHKCIIAITPHYFIALEPNTIKVAPQPTKKGAPPPKPTMYVRLCFFHVLHIKKLYYGTNYQSVRFLMIRLVSLIDTRTKKKIKPKVTIEADEVLKFAYHTLRNFCLAHSTSYALRYMELPEELRLDPETDHPELFPHFNADLSPSEMFQFSYFALCSNEKQKYVHDVVRYFHHQVINHNGIFNIGHLPFRFMPEKSMTRSELIPIFRALIYIPYMFGIVCSRFERPDVFFAISFHLRKTRALRLLYLSDCGATTGLEHISRALQCNPDAPIEYIDFSRNKFNDFVGFFNRLFDKRKNPIWYINLNYCGMIDYNVLELFTALANNPPSWGVKYLHIAGSEVLDVSLQRFEQYLRVVSEAKKQSLLSFDISDIKLNVKAILALLNKYPMPLKALYLANDQLDKQSYDLLCNIIENSDTLCTLDISNTGLNAEQVANIITLLSNRSSLLQLTIIINKLNLNGSALIAVVKGFLNGELSMWKKISMDTNYMHVSDLQLLTALFTRMPNLRELSLSDNFDASMAGIEYELPDILRIRNLEVLHIGGGQNKSLGVKLLPFLFAVGLSFEIRSYIGGYPARETIPPLNQFKDAITDIFEAFLTTKICSPEGINDVDELKERVGELVIPYLIRKGTLDAEADLFKYPTGKLEMIKRLLPLLIQIAEKNKYDEKFFQYTKFFGAYVIPFVNEAHNLMAGGVKGKETKIAEKLADRISPLIRPASKLCALRQLDIRNNKIGDFGVQAVIELLNFDNELKNVDIDGSRITTITLVSDFVSCCEKNENLTRQQFPINDAKRIIRTAKVYVKDVAERELIYSQMRLSRAVDMHRAKVGEFTDLPFDIVPELEKLIERRVEDIVKFLPPETLRNHSGIVEEFQLMLPYLDDDYANGNKLPDTYKKIDIGEQEKYLAPSMRKRFIEGDENELPLQYIAYELRRRQVGEGGEQTDVIESSAAPFEEPQKPAKDQSFEEDEEEISASPFDIKQMVDEMMADKENNSSDDEMFDAAPPTGQFELDENLFTPSDKKKKIKGSMNEIDLNDDDGEMPNFYEGDSGHSAKSTNNRRTSRRVKKLDSQANISLNSNELNVDISNLSGNVKPPSDDEF